MQSAESDDMTGHPLHRRDSLERIERLREALGVSLDSARHMIASTRKSQDTGAARYRAAMQRIDRANQALRDSVGLIG